MGKKISVIKGHKSNKKSLKDN